MDSNAGRFVEEQQAEEWMSRIAVGEVVKIKGEELEVTKIGEREITLKLLSFEERNARAMKSLGAMRGALAESGLEGLLRSTPDVQTEIPPRNRHERRAADAKTRKEG